MFSYKTLGAIALAAAVLLPGAAQAAASAVATTNVNLRAGPSTAYPVVNVVRGGHGVRVYGCLSNRSWCDVSYGGHRGWMSSNYLAFASAGQRYTGPRAVTQFRAPVISFSFGTYWDKHYRGRPFYRERHRWEPRHRNVRRDFREERRDRWEARPDRRGGRPDHRDPRRRYDDHRDRRH